VGVKGTVEIGSRWPDQGDSKTVKNTSALLNLWKAGSAGLDRVAVQT